MFQKSASTLISEIFSKTEINIIQRKIHPHVFTTHSVPEQDLRKKCLKGMMHIFRVQFIWQFQNDIIELGITE